MPWPDASRSLDRTLSHAVARSLRVSDRLRVSDTLPRPQITGLQRVATRIEQLEESIHRLLSSGVSGSGSGSGSGSDSTAVPSAATAASAAGPSSHPAVSSAGSSTTGKRKSLTPRDAIGDASHPHRRASTGASANRARSGSGSGSESAAAMSRNSVTMPIQHTALAAWLPTAPAIAPSSGNPRFDVSFTGGSMYTACASILTTPNDSAYSSFRISGAAAAAAADVRDGSTPGSPNGSLTDVTPTPTRHAFRRQGSTSLPRQGSSSGSANDDALFARPPAPNRLHQADAAGRRRASSLSRAERPSHITMDIHGTHPSSSSTSASTTYHMIPAYLAQSVESVSSSLNDIASEIGINIIAPQEPEPDKEPNATRTANMTMTDSLNDLAAAHIPDIRGLDASPHRRPSHRQLDQAPAPVDPLRDILVQTFKSTQCAHMLLRIPESVPSWVWESQLLLSAMATVAAWVMPHDQIPPQFGSCAALANHYFTEASSLVWSEVESPNMSTVMAMRLLAEHSFQSGKIQLAGTFTDTAMQLSIALRFNKEEEGLVAAEANEAALASLSLSSSFAASMHAANQGSSSQANDRLSVSGRASSFTRRTSNNARGGDVSRSFSFGGSMSSLSTAAVSAAHSNVSINMTVSTAATPLGSLPSLSLSQRSTAGGTMTGTGGGTGTGTESADALDTFAGSTLNSTDVLHSMTETSQTVGPTTSELTREAEREMRRRVWWSLYLMDRCHAAILHSQPRISDKHCHLNLASSPPRSLEASAAEVQLDRGIFLSGEPFMPLTRQHGLLSYLILLQKVNGDIITFLSRRRRGELTEHDAEYQNAVLDMSLSTCFASLPPQITLHENNEEDSTHPQANWISLLLIFTFHSAVVTLHRPKMLEYLVIIVEWIQNGHNAPHPPIPHTLEHAYQASVRSARQMTMLISNLLLGHNQAGHASGSHSRQSAAPGGTAIDIRTLPIYIHYCIYNTGVTHFLIASAFHPGTFTTSTTLSQPSTPAGATAASTLLLESSIAHQHLGVHLEALERMSQVWPAAAERHMVLRNLLLLRDPVRVGLPRQILASILDKGLGSREELLSVVGIELDSMSMTGSSSDDEGEEDATTQVY
ncbi:hypothetical protein BC831DRAFT_435923 [Entophlyctis helioformis]|nr:hypothetical protein BC831DRAFT_435923 [Entophlyctis helioformis]